MKRPPLVWLQAFEAAGRTGSFKAAAVELSVSPSNISHQIRDLEAYLGVLLFSRQGRQIQLTAEGQSLLPELSEGFQRIRAAVAPSGQSSDALQIGAFPFLANEVLTPGMDALKKVLGDVDVRLFTQTDLGLLQHVDPGQRLDVIIRYGSKPPRFPGFVAQHLADLSLVPIASPGSSSLTSATDIVEQPLINVIGPFRGWPRWCQANGIDVVPDTFTLATDSYHAAMLAVERGEGICLGIRPYINPWLTDGRIQALDAFALSIDDYAAYAVSAAHKADDRRIHAFTTWLKDTLS